jgi:type II restriction/modification system DNA methylase subunit YeeA
VKKLVTIFKDDWDSLELSWDFKVDKLISHTGNCDKLSDVYYNYRNWSEGITNQASQLETANNSIYSDTYNIKTNKETVHKEKISLFANPIYRLGKSEDIELKFCSIVITDLISYMLGCMMGRYSLDREGLVYAHSNNDGFKTLVEEGAYTRFPADGDGILSLTYAAWFEDDIATRVEEFVHTVWGDKHLEENLQFIADSLCFAAIKPVKKGSETSRETIRRYLSTQFFKDHLKTYKKRPIYWLFSSGKEKAFECLVYLHRYNATTLPRMRTEYVTPCLARWRAVSTAYVYNKTKLRQPKLNASEKTLTTLSNSLQSCGLLTTSSNTMQI